MHANYLALGWCLIRIRAIVVVVTIKATEGIIVTIMGDWGLNLLLICVTKVFNLSEPQALHL